nr:4-hydroxyphenylpyruvate dioxygenase [Malus domestica]
MPMVAKSDLSTGNQIHASYLLRSDDLVFLFTAPYSPTLTRNADPARPRTTASIPTFDHSASRAFSATHGLGVRAVAIQVEDAVSAFTASVAHGAKPSAAPILLDNRVTIAEVQLYGDVVLRYVSYTDHNHLTDPDPHLWFLPGFESLTSSFPIDFGIRRLDHAVGNVEVLKSAVSYVKGFTGFHEFAEFTAEDFGTSESRLNSVVLANNEEMVLFPMNEPVYGTKRKSQIQTYLEHNEGAGVQHLALANHIRRDHSESGVHA